MSTPVANRDEETENTPVQNVVPQRSSVPSFILLSFLLFMLTSHNGDEFLARHQHQDALKALTWQLGNYTAWMNGTEANFTVPDRDPTLGPLLDAFSVQGEELNPSESSYYLNITGFIHGNSQFYNLSTTTLNDTLPWRSLAENYMQGFNATRSRGMLGAWNWKVSTKATLSVVEKKPLGMDEKPVPESDLALVHGRIELNDEKSGEDLRFDFEGVHFLSNGSIYGFAEPPGGRIDLRLLPSLVPDVARNETAAIIAPELKHRITKLKNLIDAGVLQLESPSEETPKTTCPFTFIGHVNPANVPKFLMQELEDELQNPTGISTIPQPKLSLNGVFLSKECGILYTIGETEGLRSRTFFRKVTTYAGLTALGYLTLLILLTRQLTRSRSPSGISRASRWTFLSQATMDSVSFAGHITFAILAEGRPSMSLVAPAFLACILFVQEAQFFALINQIQGVERVYVVPPPQPQPTPTSTAEPAGAVSPPPPAIATATPAAMPTPIQTADGASAPQPGFWGFLRFVVQHIQTDPQAQLWVALFLFLALIVQVILSPTLTVIFVTLTYSAIWLPQIVRSARRNRESGLAVEYVLGVTVVRVGGVLYFLSNPSNILEVTPRPWVPYFVAFIFFQAAFLMIQDRTGTIVQDFFPNYDIDGPGWWLPDSWKIGGTGPGGLGGQWDWHPPLGGLLSRDDGLLDDKGSFGKKDATYADEDAEDIEGAPAQSLGDCAICMEGIYVDEPAGHYGHSQSSSVEDNEEREGLLSGRATSSNAGTSASTGAGTRSTTSWFFRTRRSSNSQTRKRKKMRRKNYSLAPCHHLFHTECLERWLAIKNICPQCRRPLPPL